MRRSGWWSRSRGLPPAAYAAWRSSLAAEHPERPARMLAWARGPEAYAVGSPAGLSVGEVSWQHVGWHEIERGGWNAELSTLSWRHYGGRQGSVGLTDPGRLPELFRERIAASIALERFVPVAGQRGVVVTARRDLAAADGAISWHSTLTRGLTWQTDGVQAAADEALARLRSEYDLR